ncbi:hypothetical protein DFH06DRAFT_1234627 [Mycena polygramma]|nr:hypothetical protein DFH06DRAFT_1234627 [Mycena polygramma]
MFSITLELWFSESSLSTLQSESPGLFLIELSVLHPQHSGSNPIQCFPDFCSAFHGKRNGELSVFFGTRSLIAATTTAAAARIDLRWRWTGQAGVLRVTNHLPGRWKANLERRNKTAVSTDAASVGNLDFQILAFKKQAPIRRSLIVPFWKWRHCDQYIGQCCVKLPHFEHLRSAVPLYTYRLIYYAQVLCYISRPPPSC